jgi:phosphoribosylglycinamide formyltransferase-1
VPREDVIRDIVTHIPARERAKLSVGVLASGNGSNLQALIDFSKTQESFSEITSVISNSPGSFALVRAQKHEIHNYLVDHRTFESKNAFENVLLTHLENDKVELVVLAGFMRVLSPVFLTHFQNRVINLHPSLLPKHRGLNAIGKALLGKDTCAGCTVHLVDYGLDTGPIIAQSACPIFNDDDITSLTSRIRSCEHELLPRVVNRIARLVVTRDSF